MTVCNRCGKENQDHYKFCLGCGAELTAAPKPGGDVAMMKTMMADPAPGQPMRGGGSGAMPPPGVRPMGGPMPGMPGMPPPGPLGPHTAGPGIQPQPMAPPPMQPMQPPMGPPPGVPGFSPGLEV